MLTKLLRLPLYQWPVAWGFTGLGFYFSGMVPYPYGAPRDGPLWPALVFGMIAWGWAGSMSFHGKIQRKGVLTWGLTFALAFACSQLAPERPYGKLADVSWWQQFAPFVLAALGTTVGPVVHVLTGPRYWPMTDLLRFTVGWAFSCFAAALASPFLTVLGLVLAESATQSPALKPWLTALAYILGASWGGFFPGMAAMIARDHRPHQRVELAELEELEEV